MKFNNNNFNWENYESAMPIRQFKPQPFVDMVNTNYGALPIFLDYGHLVHWYFFITCIIVILFLFFFSQLLVNDFERRFPKRETRGFSRAQVGDYITSVIPLTWSITMLIHASTHSQMFDENTTGCSFTFGIVGYQWGWNYYYPRNIVRLCFNLKYNKTNYLNFIIEDCFKNNLFKNNMYQFENYKYSSDINAFLNIFFKSSNYKTITDYPLLFNNNNFFFNSNKYDNFILNFKKFSFFNKINFSKLLEDQSRQDLNYLNFLYSKEDNNFKNIQKNFSNKFIVNKIFYFNTTPSLQLNSNNKKDIYLSKYISNLNFKFNTVIFSLDFFSIPLFNNSIDSIFYNNINYIFNNIDLISLNLYSKELDNNYFSNTASFLKKNSIIDLYAFFDMIDDRIEVEDLENGVFTPAFFYADIITNTLKWGVFYLNSNSTVDYISFFEKIRIFNTVLPAKKLINSISKDESIFILDDRKLYWRWFNYLNFSYLSYFIKLYVHKHCALNSSVDILKVYDKDCADKVISITKYFFLYEPISKFILKRYDAMIGSFIDCYYHKTYRNFFIKPESKVLKNISPIFNFVTEEIDMGSENSQVSNFNFFFTKKKNLVFNYLPNSINKFFKEDNTKKNIYLLGSTNNFLLNLSNSNLNNRILLLDLPRVNIDLDFEFINLNYFNEINSSRTINFNQPFKKINFSLFQNFFKFNYSPISKDTSSNKRLFITKAVYLPVDYSIHLIATSKDVIHSWAIPGLFCKIDCIPGFNSHRRATFRYIGSYYGQCMEVCGRYHHWMPIFVKIVHRDHFFMWCLSYFKIHNMNNYNNIYKEINLNSFLKKR